jgi:EthD domain
MTPSTRPILTAVTGPYFTNTTDYDVVSQMTFPSIENITAMPADPFYGEKRCAR